MTDTNEIQAAANKLKSLGVRIVVLGLQNAVDPRIYRTVVTQPPSKFLLTSDSFAGLSLALNAASNRICNGKFGINVTPLSLCMLCHKGHVGSI